MSRTLDRTIALLGIALLLATAVTVLVTPRGHGSSAPAGPTAKSPPGATAINIQGFAFSPAALHVSVGSKLTWTNHDAAPHTATADQGAGLETGTLNDGQSKTLSLSRPGTYAYHCAFHAFMHGTIVVG